MYDLTKEGPVNSEEPVMVMVRDDGGEKWSGPFQLAFVSTGDTEGYPFFVWQNEHNKPVADIVGYDYVSCANSVIEISQEEATKKLAEIYGSTVIIKEDSKEENSGS